MTLLQTRVEDEVAERFQEAAKRQGKSAYALLAEVVQRAAQSLPDAGWEKHRASLPAKPPLAFNACVKAREGEDR